MTLFTPLFEHDSSSDERAKRREKNSFRRSSSDSFAFVSSAVCARQTEEEKRMKATKSAEEDLDRLRESQVVEARGVTTQDER
jgi:hypothetical protein